MHGNTRMAKKIDQADVAGKLLRAIRKTEAAEMDRKRAQIKDPVSDVGTGFTIIKLQQKPLELLINAHKIGPEEIQAAEEIGLAFYTISSRLACRGISYDRVDGGRGDDIPWPARVAGAVGRYQHFAKVWSDRNKSYGDPTLEIVIAAVVDEQSLRSLAIDKRCARARAERALIGGLRDYAARAGLVSGMQGNRWRDDAERVFGPTSPVLRAAVQRARLER
jgi:hypothetical protein